MQPVPFSDYGKRFFALVLPPLVILMGISLYVAREREAALLTGIKATETLNVGLGAKALTAGFRSSVDDLWYLSENEHLRSLLDQVATPAQRRPDETVNAARQSLENTFALLIRTKSLYDQIRILDSDGHEWVRVNKQGMNAIAVPYKDLQDKSGRYYFTDAWALEADQLFVSPFDLNVERGSLERPLKPMIRLATPVTTSKGDRMGVLLLNVLGAPLLEAFLAASANISDRIYLVNRDGYFLSTPQTDETWGFMLDKPDANLKVRFPDTWPDIIETGSGQFLNDEGLWTFQSVLPADDAYQGRDAEFDGWIIVSRLNPDRLSWMIGEIHRNIWLFTLIAAAGIFGLAWSAARAGALQRTYRRQLERDLKQRTAALAEATEEAETANRTKSVFLASVSHDLRTPLNAIVGFSEMILMKIRGPLGNPAYEGYIKDIHNSGKLLVNLINDVLDISKIEAGKLDLTISPVDLIETLGDSVQQTSAAPPAKGVLVERRWQGHFPKVNADQRLLLQVFNNLLSNAFKFTPEGGTVKLALRQHPSGALVLEIADSGTGMTPEELARALHPFHQIENSSAHAQKGTGLGLFLCRKHLDLMGFDFHLHSQKGIGTRALITIPVDKIVRKTRALADD